MMNLPFGLPAVFDEGLSPEDGDGALRPIIGS